MRAEKAPEDAKRKQGSFLWNAASRGGLDLMTDVTCAICQGLGWVRENHPDKAWTEHEGGWHTPPMQPSER